MTLFLLIIEDDDDFVEELRDTIASLPGDSNIRIAGSRDQAYEMLDDGFLDLVILDLKIPTVSGALDADPEHGHAVFTRVRSVAPGTPILVLTGSPAEDFIPEMLTNQQQIDIWSKGQKSGTILFLRKLDVDQLDEKLRPVAEAVESLSDIELDRGGVNLSLAEDRLIRIFARKFQGVRCVVSKLGNPGLSGARVVRLRVTDSQGVEIHDAVAKLSSLADVRDEGDRYDQHVTRLAPSATPRKLATLEFGAHDLAGVFFGLAQGCEESAFDIAGNAPDRAEAIIRSIEAATARWIGGVPETRRTVREIRRRLLKDETLYDVRQEFHLDWIEPFEAREIQAKWACSHGDLHGCNILVSATEVTLIDYGDVGEGPASLDPVTLELSLLFHPDAPHKDIPWPSEEQARRWGDLDTYLEGCPYPDFVRACRNWALRAAAGNREIAATAYSYLIRQLKYEDTEKRLSLALLDGIRAYYD